MNEAITITLKKYKEWQQTTQKRRSWIAIDCHFFDDPKIVNLMGSDPIAIFCYQWLLMNVDEDGILKTTLKSLKRSLSRVLNKGNRFDVLKRLKSLSNESLIEFLLGSNDVLMTSLCDSNTPLEGHKEPIRKQLETPETQSYVETTNVHTIQTNNTIQTTSTPLPPSLKNEESSGSSCKFLELNIRGDRLREDEWLLRCWREQLHSQRKNLVGCETLQALVSLHPSYIDKQRRWLFKAPETRAAVILHTYLDKSPNDIFNYALKAIESNPLWEPVEAYLRQTKQAIKQGDYEVNIHG